MCFVNFIVNNNYPVNYIFGFCYQKEIILTIIIKTLTNIGKCIRFEKAQIWHKHKWFDPKEYYHFVNFPFIKLHRREKGKHMKITMNSLVLSVKSINHLYDYHIVVLQGVLPIFFRIIWIFFQKQINDKIVTFNPNVQKVVANSICEISSRYQGVLRQHAKFHSFITN